jgi:putative CocE/NonD family hydrolase
VREVRRFPRPTREIENCWIPLPDGARLAARIWLPEDAERSPVPAVLEYLPYRKRDFTRARDEPMHSYVAGHGYAAVRVDIRGSGDSEGVLTDEYSVAEQVDALAVIDWLARQPWCTGAVGMTGISWGGFNALQVAALRPAALQAIISLCASDDRYADDAHYMGGCLLNENLQWGTFLTHYNAYPPDPAIIGDGWRDRWRERLEHALLFPEPWMRHPRRDAYWRHGSVSEDLAQITCPVYAIGGWADAYSNAVPRLLAGLKSPCKGLVGPWSHAFPHDAVPGPQIGFLQEAVRWWDHWLKGRDTGIMDEPQLRVWMQASVPPGTDHADRPGRWVAEPEWPSPRIETRTLALGPLGLDPGDADEAAITISSAQTTGLDGGEWCAFGADGELPDDQRADDARSICFDGAPLAEPLEILGAPIVTLDLAVDRPTAIVAARLNDVAPDGAVTRVTYGLLNLTHRDGHADPSPLEPGRRYRVRVRLNDVAHAFPAGHRLRLALSTTYWPIAWPSAEPATVTVVTGRSALDLPVRPPRAEDAALRPFGPPERGPGGARAGLRRSPLVRLVAHDPLTSETECTVETDGDGVGGAAESRIEAIDLDVGFGMRKRLRIAEHDPTSARSAIRLQTTLRRGAWSVRIETTTELSATADAFRLIGSLRAFEGEQAVFRRDWDVAIRRDLV